MHRLYCASSLIRSIMTKGSDLTLKVRLFHLQRYGKVLFQEADNSRIVDALLLRRFVNYEQ